MDILLIERTCVVFSGNPNKEIEKERRDDGARGGTEDMAMTAEGRFDSRLPATPKAGSRE